tara:strand:+ start:585 stop:752 length:168 start_codon:yes stop_codon:yes gene_type:complete
LVYCAYKEKRMDIKEAIKEILRKQGELQANLASPSARENISRDIMNLIETNKENN